MHGLPVAQDYDLPPLGAIIQPLGYLEYAIFAVGKQSLQDFGERQIRRRHDRPRIGTTSRPSDATGAL